MGDLDEQMLVVHQRIGATPGTRFEYPVKFAKMSRSKERAVTLHRMWGCVNRKYASETAY
ncbi:unnamed protein product [Gongylonema pulchrum]|uniref:Transposase n=1 Tax=Gongylonema pulchrum TaxID=637853 RepID=A0A183D3B6_9BILA|nr:unnamed protein product [Gongylonema pulchrum]